MDFKFSKKLSLILIPIGIAVTLFGIFELIPGLGFIGWAFTFAAAGITVIHFLNLVSKNGVSIGRFEKKRKRNLK